MFARKTVSRDLRRGRELRLERLEHVELRVERVTRVHVVVVLAGPEERLAAVDALDVVDVDAVGGEDALVLGGEVVAHHADDVDLVEEARREREVRCGATEHAVALVERRLDAVERDGSNHGEAHGRALYPRARTRGSLAGLSARSGRASVQREATAEHERGVG